MHKDRQPCSTNFQLVKNSSRRPYGILPVTFSSQVQGKNTLVELIPSLFSVFQSRALLCICLADRIVFLHLPFQLSFQISILSDCRLVCFMVLWQLLVQVMNFVAELIMYFLAVSQLLLKLIIRALKLTEFCLSLVDFLAERIIYFLGVSQLLLKLFIRALKLTEFCLSLGELLAHVLKGTGLSNDFLIGFYIRFFVVVDPILGLLTILQLQLICALNVIADKNIVIIALENKAS